MASGRTHDRGTYVLTAALSVVAIVASLAAGHVATIALPLGSFSHLWLNNDLDAHSSHPYKRWRWLRWYWFPYQKAFKHRAGHAIVAGRNRNTHLPVWSDAIRVIYLLAIPITMQLLAGNFETLLAIALSPVAGSWFTGLCAATALHTLMDWLS